MNLEGNLHLDGKGGLGIPQDRTEPSFFALITGQGDGVSSPRHFYSWLRLYHDGYNGSWRVMDGIRPCNAVIPIFMRRNTAGRTGKYSL